MQVLLLQHIYIEESLVEGQSLASFHAYYMMLYAAKQMPKIDLITKKLQKTKRYI